MSFTLEPNLLVILASLLKTRSVSTAAVELGISQPSVSRALARMREELRDPLLVRQGNAMVRTPRGDELDARLADWLVHTAGVVNEQSFEPRNLNRHFRIGSTDFGLQSVIASAHAEVHREAPNSTIAVVPLEWDSAEALSCGRIDVVVTGLDNNPDNLRRKLLFTDRFACLMKPDHALAASCDTPIALADYLAHPHLGMTVTDLHHDRISQLLGADAERRKVVLNCPYFSLAPELVRDDLLLTLPRRAARHYARLHGLFWKEAPAELGNLNYWLLWHERSHRDPATQWLIAKLAKSATITGE